MSDEPADDDDGPGVERDAAGDPLRQGTLMGERESYERIIDGLKIAAEACAHLAHHEATREAYDNRMLMARNLDMCRRICIRKAGIEDAIKASPTAEIRGVTMPYRKAHDRFVYGLKQAGGGARQLATCFRIDMMWSRIADELEMLERNSRNPKRTTRRNPLLLPTGYVRH